MRLKKYVEECSVCQGIGSFTCRVMVALLGIPDAVWEDISTDFIEGLPKSHGYVMIFVVVDRLSKYSHIIALEHPFSAKTVT